MRAGQVVVIVVVVAIVAALVVSNRRRAAIEREMLEFWDTSAQSFENQGLPGVPDDSETAFLVQCRDCFVRDAGPADPAWLQALEARMARGPIQYRDTFAPFYKPRLVALGGARGMTLVLLGSAEPMPLTEPPTPEVYTLFIPAVERQQGRRFTFPDEATLLRQLPGYEPGVGVKHKPPGHQSLLTRNDWEHGFAHGGWVDVTAAAEGKLTVTMDALVQSRGRTNLRFRLWPKVPTLVEWAAWEVAPFRPAYTRRLDYSSPSFSCRGNWELREARPEELTTWAALLREETTRRQPLVDRLKGKPVWY